MLDEWKKAKNVFKKPKMNFFFGFWGTPECAIRMGKYIMETKENTFKKKVYTWLNNKIFYHTFPGLPVWRRGNIIRLFTSKQHYEYNSDGGKYVWNQNFKEKLDKYKFGWLKPSYTLPILFSFYWFKHDLMWKWKYDDVRYEFPPQITLVIFNVAFGIVWTTPSDNIDAFDSNVYWESILNYNYKHEKHYDELKDIITLSDEIGYWYSLSKDGKTEYTWNVQPKFLKDEKIAEQLKTHQILKEKEIKDRKEKLTCPKCGEKMKKVDDYMLLTYPPQYQYICPECGEIKYLRENFEND